MSKLGKQSIFERYSAEKKSYKRLLKQTEAKVVRREYWDRLESRLPWHWEPSELCAERMSGPRGLPKQISKERGYYYEYGYDSAGRIVIFRVVTDKQTSREHLVRYSTDTFAASTFFHHRELGVVLVCVGDGKLVDGRTVQLQRAGEGKKGWMEVTWDGDQPTRLVFADQRGDKPSLEWLFTKGGRLISMHQLPRKVPKGLGLNSLTNTIYERLMALIPATVAQAKVKQPAYCLILGYDGEGNGVMPPTLSVGMDSERRQFIQENRKTAKARIWSPDEFQQRLAKPRDLSGDKKLDKACECYNRLLEDKGSDAPARDLLNRVASALARLNWSKHLPVTEDFSVIAVDYECADLLKNAKKSIPASLLKKLKRQGLL